MSPKSTVKVTTCFKASIYRMSTAVKDATNKILTKTIAPTISAGVLLTTVY
ncbi:MAG: hypothetical protein GW795_01215 [Cyanobacteria bacterium]|nr:hypothetical protein [Cyanobacteria bacterium CG_2015-16_32_12]NCO77958.1 hypothetical protein [Cyanobacteria bacterium CG_2015-22_32_23]NCQ03881.1 hypothetical protein [Cyanobacteria bacterium CG_2015-09_32_10]NCQ40526.1 hypothetical protein [Cyanobacteria bacterium CG_2015-04_32_10]